MSWILYNAIQHTHQFIEMQCQFVSKACVATCDDHALPCYGYLSNALILETTIKDAFITDIVSLFILTTRFDIYSRINWADIILKTVTWRIYSWSAWTTMRWKVLQHRMQSCNIKKKLWFMLIVVYILAINVVFIWHAILFINSFKFFSLLLTKYA